MYRIEEEIEIRIYYISESCEGSNRAVAIIWEGMT